MALLAVHSKKNIDVDDLITCVINSAIKKKINFNIHYYGNTNENEFEYEVFFQKDSIPYEHEMNVDGHSLSFSHVQLAKYKLNGELLDSNYKYFMIDYWSNGLGTVDLLLHEILLVLANTSNDMYFEFYNFSESTIYSSEDLKKKLNEFVNIFSL
ncbi:hypothetical protein [Flectobacillus roseus]|uniref:Uncharacterized protein n=1 Tax=Flectobacillus roseus TaxID=502259 RepID=A0ABT6YGF9_9BACT|nr:hypothetical protein [Flectobacillus roseus]MDI9862509.1 hypothetical protein [Flectobacillus roseus]